MTTTFVVLRQIEPSNNVIVWIFILVAVAAVFIRFISVFKDGYSLIKENAFKSGAVKYGPRTTENAATYLSNFPYYQKLSPAGKDKFIRRTLNFLNTKTIEGENNYVPDYAAKIHVAAAATQLSFGLQDFVFEHFDDVVLYPDIFKVSPNAPLMKGATTPDGVVRISIKDFDEGFKNDHDKLNVGLHELGHALFMELLKEVSDEQHELEEQTYSTTKVVHPYLMESDKILKAGKQHDNFLRDYAFTNRHEFFAVSVEHFFEAPAEFKEKLPELYKVMTDLLNQDPLNVGNDYALSKSFVRIN